MVSWSFLFGSTLAFGLQNEWMVVGGLLLYLCIRGCVYGGGDGDAFRFHRRSVSLRA